MDNESRAFKAKQLRYKKPISKKMNLEQIKLDLMDMMEKCEDIHWFDNDQESLVAALCGNEDDAHEFKMAFCDLEAELERFRDDLEDSYISDYFDVLFPAAKADFYGGYLGYDSFEGDYMGIEPYEYLYAEDAAVKKVMSLTKKELLEAMGSCLKISHQYMSVKYRFDCLDAAMSVLRSENIGNLKLVKNIEEIYEKAEKSSCHFDFMNGDVADLDKALTCVPQEYWVQ